MTSFRLRPGRFCALCACLLLTSTLASAQSDLRATFDHAVELLRQGDRSAALLEFQRVLAMDPSHEAAYELWKETDHEVWLELLTERGEFELIGRRLTDLARLGRSERVDDEAAIGALLDDVFGDDPIARRRAVAALAAQHGEFAVPRLLDALSDEVDGDRRVLAIHTLTEMGPSVVLPLVEALESDNAFLRRQVAFTLGYIGDQRAAPALAAHGQSDEDAGVAQAARDSLTRIGGSTDALTGYLALGTAYRNGDPRVLAPGLRSSVVWSWESGLEKTAVPGFLWADSMAASAFYDALAVDPSSHDAAAGIAGSLAGRVGLLEARERGGVDVGSLLEESRNGLFAVAATGSAALDAALNRALEVGDEGGATVLCSILAESAPSATAALGRALAEEGPLRSEAAIALGRIALRSGAAVEPGVAEALSRTASREILRIAGIIDADPRRTSVVQGELEARGVVVRSWDRGAVALASLRRAPGFDVLIVGESLPDITVHQVLGEIRGDDRLSNAPLLMAADDADVAGELYGDQIGGILTADDLSALDEALSVELSGERAAAAELASHAAQVLGALSQCGRIDVIPMQGMLLAALERDDSVTIPIMQVLGQGGDATAITPLAAVVTDDSRSTEVRVAAADALTGIFGRLSSSSPEVDGLMGVALSDEDFVLRLAVSRALGAFGLAPDAQLALLNGVRSPVGQ